MHKLVTLHDPNLKRMLIMTESEEADAINNALLRKSIRTLTESFLAVFETYFRLQVNVRRFKKGRNLLIFFKKDVKKFEEKDFFKFLELQKFSFRAYFSSSADIIKVYAKFIRSTNFLQFMKNYPHVYFVKNIYK